MLGIPIASAAQPRDEVSPKQSQSDGIPAIPGKSQVKRRIILAIKRSALRDLDLDVRYFVCHVRFG
jgi:hypothetical protein